MSKSRSKKVTFVPYPDYQQQEFYQQIYNKKEFHKTKSQPFPSKSQLDKYLNDSCNPKRFNIQKYQEFVRNFISSSTQYNGLLMFWGVGTGKCVLPETEVYVNGHLEQIHNLWDDLSSNHVITDQDGGQWITLSKPLYINAVDQDTGLLVEAPIMRVYRQKICEPIRNIQLDNGSQLRTTLKHKLLTEKGWTNQFDGVTSVAVPNILYNERSPISIGDDLATFLGWHMLYSYEKNENCEVRFTNISLQTSYHLIELFVKICDHYHFSDPKFLIDTYGTDGCCLGIISESYRNFLQQCGYQWGTTYDEPQLPQCLVCAIKSEVKTFLRVYCDRGMVIDHQERCITLIHKPMKQLIQISHMFKLFGIETTRSVTIDVTRGVLKIDKCELHKFNHEIGFINVSKQKHLGVLCTQIADLGVLEVAKLRDVMMIKIESIEERIYDGYVYDLEIEHYHNYVANGIICHNTCGAMQIAEGLKDNVHKIGKKIFVLTKKQLIENFKKELYSKDRERRENVGSVRGSLQCIGDTYYVSPRDEPDLDVRELKSLKKIGQYYDFYSHRKFANYVDVDLAPNLPINENGKRMTIGQYFSDCVFIIDEAHGLTTLGDESEKKLLKSGHTVVKQSERRTIDVFNEIFEDSTGIKLILLTATPMQDTADDVMLLLDMLRRNDKHPPLNSVIEPSLLTSEYKDLLSSFDKREIESGHLTYANILFPSETDVNELLLKKLFRGYVSYVRGEDPRTFPEVINFTPDKIHPHVETYIPKPLFDDDGQIIPEEDKVIHISLIKCQMSSYQFSNYLRLMSKDEDGDRSHMKETVGLQVSDMVFPTAKMEKYPKYGKSGFYETFKEHTTQIETKGRKRVHTTYEYQPSIVGFLHLNKIGEYSRKLEIYLHNVINSKGIIYTYTEFVESGAHLIALMLEQNGYTRYGKENRNLLRPELRPEDLRCAICGYTRKQHTGDPNSPVCFDFSPAKYVLYTGEEKLKGELTIVNHVDNKDGRNIKIIIGTRASGEGVDYRMIREVHIIDPWHNYTRLYQVIGRAARHCSHVNLKLEDRKVTVFKYSSAPPEYYDRYRTMYHQRQIVDLNVVVPESKDYRPFTFKQLFEETPDEKVYRRVERKDVFVKRVERALKTSAVDCALNRNINIFHNDFRNDRDGSRECDYMECDYQCEGFDPQGPEQQPELNTDTYNLYFSEPQIKRIIQYIIEFFRVNFAMKLEHIVYEIVKEIPDAEESFIYEAIDRVIGRMPYKHPILITDKFNRQGHLIYSDPYYIFQPDELLDPRAPTYYKMTPMTIKKRYISLEPLKEVAPATAKETVGAVAPTAKSQLEKKMRELVAFTEKPRPVQTYKYEIQYQLARISDPILQEIYETITGQKRFNDLLLVIDDYLSKCGKLYIYTASDGTVTLVGHHIAGSPRKYSATRKHWIEMSQSEVNMSDVDTNPEKKDNIDGVAGYVIYEKNEYKFKLIDFTKEKLQQLKADPNQPKKKNKISKKSIKSGQVCVTTDLGKKLKPIAESLGIDLNTISNSSRDSLCKVIEMKCRERDDKDLVYKWFYYSGEKRQLPGGNNVSS